MNNKSMYHQTTIEKIMLMSSPLSSSDSNNNVNKHHNPEKSDLLDMRIQIFIALSEKPYTKFTLDELADEINSKNMVCILPSRKEKLGLLLNIMYNYDLIAYDFATRTYSYKHSEPSNILKNNIELLKAL